jgi:hypothetical protein
MSIPIVPNKNKNLGKSISDEERQLRVLEGEGMMSQSLNEQIKKMAQNPTWMDKGLAEEAVLDKEVPVEEVEVIEFPGGGGFGPGLGGGGMGRGRAIPGVPGTGPRGGTPACPLSEDSGDEEALIVDDEAKEEPEIFITEDDDVVEEIEEDAEVGVQSVISKMEEALSELKGLFDEDFDSFNSMEESLEQIRGLINEDEEFEEVSEKIPGVPAQDGSGGGTGHGKKEGVPGIHSGEGPGKDFSECPMNEKDDDLDLGAFKETIVKDYFDEVPASKRSLTDLNSKLAGNISRITKKEYTKLAKKLSTAKPGKTSKKVELIEVELNKKASAETDKFTQSFPELRNYKKVENYSGGSKKSS